MGEYQKHTKLKRPAKGKWGRNEWSIIGTTCDKIKGLVEQISLILDSTASIAYIDASHNTDSESGSTLFLSLTQGEKEYKVVHRSADKDYDQKILLDRADIILVNGNHFDCDRQIVVMDPIKKDSLHRKLNKLTCIDAVLMSEGQGSMYDFLDDLVPPDTLIYKESELSDLCNNLLKSVKNTKPLNGLILAGGKSSRLGIDKSNISYYGVPQKEYIAKMIAPFCEEVFISENEITQEHYSTIVDSFISLGPLGGILSAFRLDPDAAWLAIAVDMPFVDVDAIVVLLNKRDISKIATCYKRKDAEFPDPLFTIWEPKAYQRILHFLALGFSCPRKVLINSDVHVIEIEDNNVLTNVNNLSDYENALLKIAEE